MAFTSDASFLRKMPRQTRAAATLDAILDATAQLLAAGGSLTTNSIAARAGVSIGSFYQYLPDRQAAVRALVLREQRARAAMLAALAQQLADAPLPQIATALIDAAIAIDVDNPALARALDHQEALLGDDLAIEAAAAALDTALVPLFAPSFPADRAGDTAARVRLLRRVVRTVIDDCMPDSQRARREASVLLLGYLASA